MTTPLVFGELPKTPRLVEILKRSEQIARDRRDIHLGIEHVLLAMSEQRDGPLASIADQLANAAN
jgi:hypothetical protein